MRRYLSFLLLFRLLFTDASCHQKEFIDGGRDLISSGADASSLCPTVSRNPTSDQPLVLSENEPVASLALSQQKSRLHEDANQPNVGGHLKGTQSNPVEAKSVRALELNPEAKPFVPFKLAEMKPSGHPKPGVAGQARYRSTEKNNGGPGLLPTPGDPGLLPTPGGPRLWPTPGHPGFLPTPTPPGLSPTPGPPGLMATPGSTGAMTTAYYQGAKAEPAVGYLPVVLLAPGSGRKGTGYYQGEQTGCLAGDLGSVNSVVGSTGRSTVLHQHFGTHPIHQKANLAPDQFWEDAEQYWDLPNDMSLEGDVKLLYKYSGEFRRAEELKSWFESVVPSSPTRPKREARRKVHLHLNFVAKYMAYKTAYGPFHALPAIEGDHILGEGFLATYDFGRKALNVYREHDAKRIIYLLHTMKQRTSTLKPMTDDELYKLFYWSIILAGAKEWFYREAANFSGYLWILEQKTTESSPQTNSWFSEYNVGYRLKFDNLKDLRKDELNVMGKILGHDQEGGTESWLSYLKDICGKGDYHLVNSEIERTIYENFGQELKHGSNTKIVSIPQEKTDSYSEKWGLPQLTIQQLVRTAKENCVSRERSKMGYDLASDSLNYFSQKLLSFANHLSEKNGLQENPLTNEASGKLLVEIYDPMTLQKLVHESPSD